VVEQPKKGDIIQEYSNIINMTKIPSNPRKIQQDQQGNGKIEQD